MSSKKNFLFKYSFIYILFSLIVLSLFAKTDWTFKVNVGIKDLESKESINGANIVITDLGTNNKIHNSLSNAEKATTVSLDPDKDYLVKISKTGYVSKTISISTKNVPFNDKTIPSYIFDVTVDLFSEEPNEDYSDFRQPFGSIMFDEKSRDFFWRPNAEAKRKEENLKAQRKVIRKNEEKNRNKNIKEQGKSELELLTAKKSDALSKAIEKDKIRKEQQDYKEFLRQEALSSFNIDYAAPKMIYAKLINTETIEHRNYIVTFTTVTFEDNRQVVYRKIIFEWGGVYYKQDAFDITEETYDLLMKIIVLKG